MESVASHITCRRKMPRDCHMKGAINKKRAVLGLNFDWMEKKMSCRSYYH